MPLLLFAWSAVCAALGFYALALVGIGLYFGVIRNLSAPLVQRTAQVVKKEAHQGVALMLFTSAPCTTFTVALAFPNGKHEHFGINTSQYQRLQIGSRGLLSSQGSWYKGFVMTTALQSVSHDQ